MRRFVWATLFLAVIGMASAVFGIFIQTIPPVQVPPIQATPAGCGSLNVASSTPILPVSGTLRFICNPGEIAGFTTTGGSSIATFTLPTFYTSLGFTPHTAINCNSPTMLTSGSMIIISAGSYDLCASYFGVPPEGASLSGFSVSWA